MSKALFLGVHYPKTVPLLSPDQGLGRGSRAVSKVFNFRILYRVLDLLIAAGARDVSTHCNRRLLYRTQLLGNSSRGSRIPIQSLIWPLKDLNRFLNSWYL